MNKHLYVVYPNDDTSVCNENDLTHWNLIDQGYEVINKEIGYIALYRLQNSYRNSVPALNLLPEQRSGLLSQQFTTVDNLCLN